jgi:hypothetical protein
MFILFFLCSLDQEKGIYVFVPRHLRSFPRRVRLESLLESTKWQNAKSGTITDLERNCSKSMISFNEHLPGELFVSEGAGAGILSIAIGYSFYKPVHDPKGGSPVQQRSTHRFY